MVAWYPDLPQGPTYPASFGDSPRHLTHLPGGMRDLSAGPRLPVSQRSLSCAPPQRGRFRRRSVESDALPRESLLEHCQQHFTYDAVNAVFMRPIFIGRRQQ